MDAMRGNASLFMRRDEVEAAWRFIDPIREAWSHSRRAAAPLCRGHLGTRGVDRADRARRAHLERGIRMSETIPRRREFADGAALAPAFADWTADLLAPAIAARGVALLDRLRRHDAEALFSRRCRSATLDWSRVADHARRRAARARRQPALQRAAGARDPAARSRRAPAQFAPLADSRLDAASRNSPPPRARIAQLPTAGRSRRARHGRRRPHRLVVSRTPTGSPRRSTRPRARWSQPIAGRRAGWSRA